MQNLQSEPSLANAALDDDVMEAAGDRVRQAISDMIRSDAALGMADDVAVMFMQDPLKAELLYRDAVHDLARSVLGDAFERIDDHGDTLEVDGRTYRKVDATRGQAMTMFGPVGYDRARYRPSGAGASVFPTERVLGLTESSLTPAAAGLSLYLMANLSARESADAWVRLCGSGPSTSSLIQLTTEAGRRFEDCSGDLLAELRSEEEVHEDATALLVSLDGVMVRMNAETVDGSAVDAGWREASSGLVSLLDADGNMVQTSYFGRLPEQGKLSLKAQVSQEAFHWLGRKEDLTVVAIADGARDNWAFLDTFSPDVVLLDFFHAAQHLKVAADAAFGPDSAEGEAWFEKWRHVLRHDPKGANKVIDALRYLSRKGKGTADIVRELGYFRNNRKRMNYSEVADAGYPIGSGAVEAANKVLVSTRMKRSGQRWSRDGGQGVLTYRSLLRSDRFDRAWAVIARSWQQWKPPTAVNDNHALALAA